jgi:GNAT superfamily N-acetyltransferase
MTGDAGLTFALSRDPRAEDIITAGLAAYNRDTFGRVDTQTLDILVRDDKSGEIVGGLLGRTSLGLFFLDLFYLPAELRRGGLGSRIIARAEDEARRRGCTRAVVYTVTFQAPGFYEKHGYRRFGEIACPPDGATRIFLSKSLD